MKSNQPNTVPGNFKFVLGVLVGAFLLGICADSDTRTAFAHGIINAFGIEYDNQSSGLQANDVQAAIDEQGATYATHEARIDAIEVAFNRTSDVRRLVTV